MRSLLLPALLGLALACAAGCDALKRRERVPVGRETWIQRHGPLPELTVEPPCWETVAGASFRPVIRARSGPVSEEVNLAFTPLGTPSMELPFLATIAAGEEEATYSTPFRVFSSVAPGAYSVRVEAIDLDTFESTPLFEWPVYVRASVIDRLEVRRGSAFEGMVVFIVEIVQDSVEGWVDAECVSHRVYGVEASRLPGPSLKYYPKLRVAHAHSVIATGESYPALDPAHPSKGTTARPVFVVLSEKRVGPAFPDVPGPVLIRVRAGGEEVTATLHP